MIERIRAGVGNTVVFHHDGLREYTVNLNAEETSTDSSAGQNLDGATPLTRFIFDDTHHVLADAPMIHLMGNENGLKANRTGGVIQTLAIGGAAVRPVELDARRLGYTYADRYADYCLLTGLLPGDTSKSRTDQACDCMTQMAVALQYAGMSVTDITRTWFYLNNLLDWYDDFNRVRDDFFDHHGISQQCPPASTGIGAGNTAGADIVAGVLAIRPRRTDCRIIPVVSPMQCPAMDYRSTFSRAVEMMTPEWRRLIISGTASIDSDGRTIHAGDVDRQIKQTLDVCEALLTSREMSWHDVTRAIAYFTHRSDFDRLEPIIRRRGMPDIPRVLACGCVCREYLLFEIELDAVRQQSD